MYRCNVSPDFPVKDKNCQMKRLIPLLLLPFLFIQCSKKDSKKVFHPRLVGYECPASLDFSADSAAFCQLTHQKSAGAVTFDLPRSTYNSQIGKTLAVTVSPATKQDLGTICIAYENEAWPIIIHVDVVP